MLNKHKLPWLLLFGVFVSIYFFNIMRVAPEYNELLVANAAINCPSNTFVENVYWVRGQCFPLMLSSYIGGIMAIPYRLIFAVFSPDLLNFRLINVTFFGLSPFFIYLAIKKVFNEKLAWLTSVLLIFDFQLWFNVRFERTMIVPFF